MKDFILSTTKKLIKAIRNQKGNIVKIGNVRIKICKNVFPPQSEFSSSSKNLRSIFGSMRGKVVLDIGTGTGIHAIEAAKAGAKEVWATDISQEALKCARENVKINKVEEKVRVFKSDLFNLVKNKKFDIVIPNLPIVYTSKKQSIVAQSLFDRGYVLHKRMLREGKRYLKKNGFIIFSHAVLQPNINFEFLEEMIKNNGYVIRKIASHRAIGYEWRFYKIAIK